MTFYTLTSMKIGPWWLSINFFPCVTKWWRKVRPPGLRTCFVQHSLYYICFVDNGIIGMSSTIMINFFLFSNKIHLGSSELVFQEAGLLKEAERGGAHLKCLTTIGSLQHWLMAIFFAHDGSKVLQLWALINLLYTLLKKKKSRLFHKYN